MPQSLPYWLQVTSAVATPAIAFAVFVVALRQWSTAQSKLVLDLFEKRFQLFADLQSLISEMGRDAKARGEKEIEFKKLVQQARFLFGSEFLAHLYRAQESLLDIGRAEVQMDSTTISDEEKARHKARSDKGYEFLLDSIETFPRLAEPYLRMNQRLNSSLWQRWEDARRPQRPFNFKFLYPTQAHLQVPGRKRDHLRTVFGKIRMDAEAHYRSVKNRMGSE